MEKAEPPVKNAFPPKPSMPSKPTHTFSKPSFGSHQNENQDDQEDKRNIASSLFLDQARKPREASFSPPPNSAAPRGKLRENYSLVSKNFTENLTTSSPELHKQTKPTGKYAAEIIDFGMFFFKTASPLFMQFYENVFEKDASAVFRLSFSGENETMVE